MRQRRRRQRRRLVCPQAGSVTQAMEGGKRHGAADGFRCFYSCSVLLVAAFGCSTTCAALQQRALVRCVCICAPPAPFASLASLPSPPLLLLPILSPLAPLLRGRAWDRDDGAAVCDDRIAAVHATIPLVSEGHLFLATYIFALSAIRSPADMFPNLVQSSTRRRCWRGVLGPRVSKDRRQAPERLRKHEARVSKSSAGPFSSPFPWARMRSEGPPGLSGWRTHARASNRGYKGKG